MFGFCMSRVGTFVLRLASATRPGNVRLAIAALIFSNIGVLVIYIVVLVLALRVFRATHPKLGWNESLSKALPVAYSFLLGAVLLVIAFTILSFYTLNPTLRTVALWVQRAAILYLLIFNVMSLVLLLLSMLLPRAPDNENFGTGSMDSKLIILGVAVFFTIFIAGFRMGTSWAAARPASNPAWFDSKAAFYVILFGFEIVIVYLFLFTRFDRRFWVPNGSHKPGDYFQLDPDSSTTRKTLDQDMELGRDKELEPDKELLQDKELEPDKESEQDRELAEDKELEPNKESEQDKELGQDKESEQDKELGQDKELKPDKELGPDKELEPDKELGQEQV